MVYDLIPLLHPEFCAQLVSRVFQRWLAEMVCASDAVLCISAAVEKDLRDYTETKELHLPPIGHFRLGCDPAFQTGVHPPRQAIVDFLCEPEVIFASVGSFEPRKNYAWLLKFFEGLWAEGHNVRLFIAGRPTADGQKLIEKMKLHPEQGHRLLTVFDANDQELEYVYRHARALLFPSLAEGFGLPLVEARTRGCQVIASDLDAFRELVDDGVMLFPKDNEVALEALIIQCSALDTRDSQLPMPLFSWRDSACQFRSQVQRLLAGSS